MTANYKFTQNCEINNIEYKKGDIIGPDQGIVYNSFVMTTTDEHPTISLNQNAKVEITKIEKAQNNIEPKTDKKAETKPNGTAK